MFTGLIEATGTVKSLSSATGGTGVLTVDLGSITSESEIGDSIAINGVCLTVTRTEGTNASFDLSRETLERSSLKHARPGTLVNIERALLPSSRLAGHIVQGHIDGTAKIASIERRSTYADIRFTAESDLLNQMVPKGSVAIDGISLTIATVDNKSFGVAIIPETLAKTTLAAAKPGDTVNIEVDIVVKTVKRQLENMLSTEGSLTMEKLKQMGF